LVQLLQEVSDLLIRPPLALEEALELLPIAASLLEGIPDEAQGLLDLRSYSLRFSSGSRIPTPNRAPEEFGEVRRRNVYETRRLLRARLSHLVQSDCGQTSRDPYCHTHSHWTRAREGRNNQPPESWNTRKAKDELRS